MRKIFPLILLVAVGHSGQAAFLDYFPEAKIKAENVSICNVVAEMTQKLAHLKGERANPYGVGYAKLSAFVNHDHEIGGQFGFGYPVALNGKYFNGFYLGAFGGHLKSKTMGGKKESKLGGGFDLAYALLNKDRISTFSVGLAAGQEVKQGDYVVYET